jgi:hypothetical protein
MNEHGEAFQLSSHPTGGALNSLCPLCNRVLAQYNSSRFCQCNVYTHYHCLMWRLHGSTVDKKRKCEVCNSPYILFFEDRTTIRPVNQCTVLSHILIDVFSHSLDDGESLYEELSYLMFSMYTALFVVVTLSCCMGVVVERKCTLVALEPYHPTIVYHTDSGEEGYDLVSATTTTQIDDSDAKVKPDQKLLTEPR